MDDKLIAFYNRLKEDGYALPATPEEFGTLLQQENNLDRMYERLKKDGYALPGSSVELGSLIFTGQQSAQQPVAQDTVQQPEEVAQPEAAVEQPVSEEEAARGGWGNAINSFVGSVNRGFYKAIPATMNAYNVGVKAINNYITHPLGLEGKIENLEDVPGTGAAASWLDEKIDETAYVNPAREGDFVNQAAQGLGQGAAIMATGGMAGAARGTTGLLTNQLAQRGVAATVAGEVGSQLSSAGSIAGSLQMVGQGYQEAIKGGATEDEAFLTALVEGGIGTTEALPIAKMFERLDKLSGGTITKKLVSGFQGGVEELLQEGIQTALSNVSAQNIYDEERKLMDNVAEAAGAGGASGVALNLLAMAIGGRRIRSKQGDFAMEEAKRIKEAGETDGDTPDQIKENILRMRLNPREYIESELEEAKSALEEHPSKYNQKRVKQLEEQLEIAGDSEFQLPAESTTEGAEETIIPEEDGSTETEITAPEGVLGAEGDRQRLASEKLEERLYNAKLTDGTDGNYDADVAVNEIDALVEESEQIAASLGGYDQFQEEITKMDASVDGKLQVLEDEKDKAIEQATKEKQREVEKEAAKEQAAQEKEVKKKETATDKALDEIVKARPNKALTKRIEALYKDADKLTVEELLELGKEEEAMNAADRKRRAKQAEQLVAIDEQLKKVKALPETARKIATEKLKAEREKIVPAPVKEKKAATTTAATTSKATTKASGTTTKAAAPKAAATPEEKPVSKQTAGRISTWVGKAQTQINKEAAAKLSAMAKGVKTEAEAAEAYSKIRQEYAVMKEKSDTEKKNQKAAERDAAKAKAEAEAERTRPKYFEGDVEVSKKDMQGILPAKGKLTAKKVRKYLEDKESVSQQVRDMIAFASGERKLKIENDPDMEERLKAKAAEFEEAKREAIEEMERERFASAETTSERIKMEAQEQRKRAKNSEAKPEILEQASQNFADLHRISMLAENVPAKDAELSAEDFKRLVERLADARAEFTKNEDKYGSRKLESEDSTRLGQMAKMVKKEIEAAHTRLKAIGRANKYGEVMTPAAVTVSISNQQKGIQDSFNGQLVRDRKVEIKLANGEAILVTEILDGKVKDYEKFLKTHGRTPLTDEQRESIYTTGNIKGEKTQVTIDKEQKKKEKDREARFKSGKLIPLNPTPQVAETKPVKADAKPEVKKERKLVPVLKGTKSKARTSRADIQRRAAEAKGEKIEPEAVEEVKQPEGNKEATKPSAKPTPAPKQTRAEKLKAERLAQESLIQDMIDQGMSPEEARGLADLSAMSDGLASLGMDKDTDVDGIDEFRENRGKVSQAENTFNGGQPKPIFADVKKMEEVTIEEFLDRILTQPGMERLRKPLQEVLELMDKVNEGYGLKQLRLFFTDAAMNASDGGKATGMFIQNQKALGLFVQTNGDEAHTGIHELVHHLTEFMLEYDNQVAVTKQITSNGKLVRVQEVLNNFNEEMDRVYKDAEKGFELALRMYNDDTQRGKIPQALLAAIEAYKVQEGLYGELRIEDIYGMTNAKELYSEAASNPYFAAILSRIGSKEVARYEGKANIFTELKNAIQRGVSNLFQAFGASPKDGDRLATSSGTLLDSVMSSGETFAEEFLIVMALQAEVDVMGAKEADKVFAKQVNKKLALQGSQQQAQPMTPAQQQLWAAMERYPQLIKKKAFEDFVKMIILHSNGRINIPKKDWEDVYNAFKEQHDIRVSERTKAIDAINKLLKLNNYVDGTGPVRKGKDIDLATLDKLKAIKRQMLTKTARESAMDRVALVSAAQQRGHLTDDERIKLEATKFFSPSGATTSQLNRMADALEQIVKDGKEKFEQEMEAENAEFEAAKNSAVDVVTGGRGILSEGAARLKEMGLGAFKKMMTDLGRGADGYMMRGDSVETLMDFLSRNDKGSDAMKSYLSTYVMERVRKSREDNNRLLREKYTMVSKKLEEIYGKGNQTTGQKVNDMVTGNTLKNILQRNTKAEHILTANGEKKFLNSDGVSREMVLSPNEAYKKWMEMQDPNMIDRLEANGWTPEMATRLTQHLATNHPQLLEFAKWQLEVFYPQMYKEVNEVYRKVFKTDLPYSAIYSPVALEGDNPLDTIGFDIDGGHTVSGNMNNSHLKERSHNKLPVATVDGDLVLAKYISKMSSFMAWGESTRDISKLINNRDFRKAIKQNNHKDALLVLDHFNKVLKDQYRAQEELTGAMHTLRTNFVTSVIASPGVMIKQWTSIPAYMAHMNPVKFTAGAMKTAVNPLEWHKAYKTLMSSELMKARYETGWDREIVEQMRKDYKAAFSRKGSLKQKQMFFTKFGDAGAILVGGWQVYKNEYSKHKEKGHDEAHKLALREFDRITNMTQQSGNPEDMSYFQTVSELSKLMTMFKSAQMSYMRMERMALRNAIKGRGNRAKHIGQFLVYHSLLPTIFQWVASGGDWDEEKLARAAVMGNLNGLWLAGDMIDVWSNYAIGYGQGITYSPISMLSIVNKIAREIGKGGNAEEVTMEALKESADNIGWDILGMGTGIAFPVGKRTYEGYKEATDEDSVWSENFIDQLTRIIFTGYAVKGRTEKMEEERTRQRKTMHHLNRR